MDAVVLGADVVDETEGDDVEAELRVPDVMQRVEGTPAPVVVVREGWRGRSWVRHRTHAAEEVLGLLR